MANPPFNLFDVLLVVFLAAGVVQGRKHGISVELPGMLKWLMVVSVSAVLYGPAGDLLSITGIFDLLTCYLFAYVGLAMLVFILFSIMQRKYAPKLEGSDIFGRGE